jgi:hypothetical protein
MQPRYQGFPDTPIRGARPPFGIAPAGHPRESRLHHRTETETRLAMKRPVGCEPGSTCFASPGITNPRPEGRRLRRRQLDRIPARVDRRAGADRRPGRQVVPDRRPQGGRGLRLPGAAPGHRRLRPHRQKAVWPSTGNYCRGGAFDSKLLACESVAILPEEMSRERFEWLSGVAGPRSSPPRLRVERQGDLRQVLGAQAHPPRMRDLQPVRGVGQRPVALHG